MKGYRIEESMKERLCWKLGIVRIRAYLGTAERLHFQMLPSCGRWKELLTLFRECKQIQTLWPFSSKRLQDIDPEDSDS